MSDQTPRLVRSLRRRFAITLSVIGFAVTATWLYLMFSVKTQVEILVCITGWYMGLALLAAVFKVVQVFKEARLKERVLSMDSAVCCECGYSLVGLTGHRRCPECGWEFEDIEQVRGVWNVWQPGDDPGFLGGLGLLIARVTR